MTFIAKRSSLDLWILLVPMSFCLLKAGKVPQSLTFMTLKLLKMTANLVECPSFWVCLMVPYAQIQGIYILAGILQRGVLCSSYCLLSGGTQF